MLELMHVTAQALLASPHLKAALFVGWISYLVLLGGWIVLQKRAPVATLSWLLGLAALPVVGFIVYYVFGPQRIKRQRLRRARHRIALPAGDERVRTGDTAAELSRLAQSTT